MTDYQHPYLTEDSAARIQAAGADDRIRELSEAVPFEPVISALYGITEPTLYTYLPEPVLATLAEVEARFGAAGLGIYKKGLIIQLIDRLPARVSTLQLPQPVIDLFADMLDFVVRDLSEIPDEAYLPSEDALVRELRLASARSVLCGARVVDLNSLVPKSIYRNLGWKSNLKCLWFLYGRMGGLAPLYRVHVETRYLRDFNEEGWVRTYKTIAMMMRQNPAIRGVVGTSWFYDPQLETISPWLAHLRTRPVEYGAYLRYDGPGDIHTERAIATSRKRRELYEKGQYVPTCYTLIWARKDLLRWADRQ